jgi:toxin ParE1/3/4
VDREVVYLAEAQDDLQTLYDYIAVESGHVTARDYIRRIQDACGRLGFFPERGTLRSDIKPGLRKIGFERRATIVFQVLPETVEIVRVAYGGQDWIAALGRAKPEQSNEGTGS